ncbi:MAG: hypothetical protein ABL893_13850, partial [Hyphomicrobium sp.]
NAVQHTSVVAVGLTAAFSIFVIVEFAKLLFADLREWGTENHARAARRDRALIIVILALSALQAYGVAVALKGLNYPGAAADIQLIRDPDAAFTLSFIASNVAGTALLLWLASLITQHGIGSGFWVLYLFPILAEAGGLPFDMLDRISTGEISAATPMIVAALLAALAALVITLTRRWLLIAGDSHSLRAHSIGVFIWPGYIAAALSGYIIAALTMFSNPNGDLQGLTFGSPQLLAIPALLIVGLSYLYARAYLAATPAAGQPVRGLILATMLMLAVSYIAIEIAINLYAIPVLPALPWIAAVAIFTTLLPRDVSPYLPSSPTEPPATDAGFEPRQ